jgi:hypothetical protein
MEIKSEVCGNCVEEIDVYVEVEYAGESLCCGREYLMFIRVVKAAQNLRWWWGMVPGIGWRFGRFGSY